LVAVINAFLSIRLVPGVEMNTEEVNASLVGRLPSMLLWASFVTLQKRVLLGYDKRPPKKAPEWLLFARLLGQN